MHQFLMECLAACVLQTPASEWLDAYLSGSRLLEQGEVAQARTQLERALSLLPGHAASTYQLACALAKGGARDEALTMLEHAVRLGYDDAALLCWDSDLASLRDTERFHEIIAGLSDRSGEAPPPFELVWRGPCNYISESPGVGVVAGGNVDSLTLWDARTTRILATLLRPGDIRALQACSPDGRFVIVTGERADKTSFVRVHDAATGDFLRELPEPAVWPAFCSFSDDGARLCIGWSTNGSRRASIWSTKDWTLVARVPGGYTYAVLCRDGRRMLLASEHEPKSLDIDFWDVDQGKLLERHVSASNRSYLTHALSPDASLAAVLDATGRRVLVFDAHTGARVQELSSPDSPVRGMTFTGSEGQLATLDTDGRVVVWDAREGTARRSFTVDGCDGYLSVNSPGDLLLVSGSKDPPAVIDLATGRRAWSYHEVWDYGTRIQFTHDGTSVLAAEIDSAPVLLDAHTGMVRARFDGPAFDSVSCVDPGGRWYWTTAGNGRLRVVDLSNGRTVREIEVQTDGIRALAIRPDGLALATISSTGVAHEIETATGHERWRASPQKDLAPGWRSAALLYAPDGKHLAVSTSFRSIDLLSTETGRTRQHIEPSGNQLRFCDWSQEGRRFASLVPRGELVVVDLEPEPPTVSRVQPDRFEGGVAFAPGGRSLWVANAEGIVRAVQREGGTWGVPVPNPDMGLFCSVECGSSLRFSADGQLAIGDSCGHRCVTAWRVADAQRVWRNQYEWPEQDALFTVFLDDGKRLCVWGGGCRPPRILDSRTGETLVDLGPKSLGTVMPVKGDRLLLATSARGVDAFDPATGNLRWSRVEFEQGALLHTPSGFVDAPRSVLEGTLVSLSDRSYPLDGLAAAMLDTKKVAASAAGVHVAPVRIGERPTLSWSKPLPRVLRLGADERTVEIAVEGQVSGGLLCFEVVRNGVRESRPPLAVEGDATKGRSVIEVARPAPGAAIELCVRSIAKSGLASRPLLVAVECGP